MSMMNMMNVMIMMKTTNCDCWANAGQGTKESRPTNQREQYY